MVRHHCNRAIVRWHRSTAYRIGTQAGRADERTRTALLLQLRVITQALQGLAQECKSRISKPFALLWLALCCTVLRSRWCQSGINIASYSSDTVVHGSQAGSTCGRRRACAVEIRPFHEAFGHFIHVDLLAAYVFLDRPGVLYHPSRVAPSRLWVAVRECSLRVGITSRPQWVQLGRSRKPSARSKEVHVGERGRRKGSQGRAEDRVRGRVRERVQGRPERREVSSTGRRRGTFNVGAIEGFANRFSDHGGGTSGLAGAASGLAGAASGLAGGSFAHRILDNDTESSEEDFNNELSQRLDLIDERLQRLEEQVQTFLEAGGEDVQEPESGSDPNSSP